MVGIECSGTYLANSAGTGTYPTLYLAHGNNSSSHPMGKVHLHQVGSLYTTDLVFK